MRASGKVPNLPSIINKLFRQQTKFSPDLIRAIPRADLAAELAGTKDKKSKAYATARDNLSRYLRGGRRATKASQRKIERAARKIIKKQGLFEKAVASGEVTIDGLICYSRDCRDRNIQVTFDSGAMSRFFESKDATMPLEAYYPGMYYGPSGSPTDGHRIVIELDA